jgi:hypothetical protein
MINKGAHLMEFNLSLQCEKKFSAASSWTRYRNDFVRIVDLMRQSAD